MSVQEISDLHRRYVDLSQRFRAAWVYHQFIQSLAKIQDEGAPASPYAGRFQELYGQLKECSQSLTPSEAAHLQERFDAIGQEVAELLSFLLDEDSRTAPQTLRQFFRKFRNYDEKILAQLTRFYLFACAEGDWTSDRRDKVDFLVTRLGEELRGADRGADGPSREREIFASFWNLAGAAEPAEEKLEGLLRALGEIRNELSAVDNLDAFTESEALANYREFKHSLDMLFFYPAVLQAVLETNFAFRATVHRLYQKEEQRIAADYQRIFDLEREVPVDVQLDQELSLFRQQVERFEERLQRDEMRLDDLTELRQRARSLMPKLSRSADDEEGGGAVASGGFSKELSMTTEWPTDDHEPISAEASSAAALAALEAGDEEGGGADGSSPPGLIADAYRQVTAALGETTQGAPPRSIVLTPEVYPFRLETREVLAYRRLHDGRRSAMDQVMERFLLRGAALRVALHAATEEVRDALDETGPGSERLQRGRRLAALGDAYLRRYDHYQELALLAGDIREARQLALLRIRLMRDYSELWLLAHDELRKAEVE